MIGFETNSESESNIYTANKINQSTAPFDDSSLVDIVRDKESFEIINLSGSESSFEVIDSLSSSSEFDSLPEEFIPSDEEEINVDDSLLENLMKLGPELFVHKAKEEFSPQQVLVAFGFRLPPQYEDYVHVWELVKDILLRYIYVRPRLEHLENNFDSAAILIQQAKRILIITGAGISVAAGIPDFRSPNSGLYAQISKDFPHLPCPEAMFDYNYFLADPKPFYTLCKSLLAHSASPTPTHNFIKALERKGTLLRNFTQNIDTLECSAGIENITYCHGSFTSSHCLNCEKAYSLNEFRSKIESDFFLCECGGLIKPNIVFFGEPLPEEFHSEIKNCVAEADLLLVIGSSLKVQPVASTPDLLPPLVPQILINLEPIMDHNFDIVLLGDCQLICNELNTKIFIYACDDNY